MPNENTNKDVSRYIDTTKAFNSENGLSTSHLVWLENIQREHPKAFAKFKFKDSPNDADAVVTAPDKEDRSIWIDSTGMYIFTVTPGAELTQIALDHETIFRSQTKYAAMSPDSSPRYCHYEDSSTVGFDTTQYICFESDTLPENFDPLVRAIIRNSEKVAEANKK